MKKYLLLLTLFLVIGCEKEPTNIEMLNEKDEVYYTKDTNKPYSGRVVSFYENGQKNWEGNLKDGKEDGLWNWWYENGIKKYIQGTFKDGNQVGLWTIWYENGQKSENGTFKNGEMDGLWTYYYKRGQKEGEMTFKNGKLISKKQWNEDGSVKK